MKNIYKGEIQRLFPILEAIKEGKTIQWNDMGMWRDIDGDKEGFFLDTFVGEPDGYRIKPETKYRPFANAEECWKEMEKHQPFGWVQDKVSKAFYNIVFLNIKNIYIGTSNISHDYTDILFNFTFADGTPFGIKEEE